MNAKILKQIGTYLILTSLLMLAPVSLMAQITKTPWQMIHPAPPSPVTTSWHTGGSGYNQHGYAGDIGTNGLPIESTGAYQNASIPDINDAGWGNAPNGETIAFGSGSASIIDDYGYSCWAAVDYNYFQTIVNVPQNTVVTQFNIVFSSTDDGARVTLFNDDNPNGVVIAGSYFTINTGGTADLASYVTAGQNRVVVTQVDDCPTGNNLSSAQVVLNGTTVETCSIGDEQTFTILGANGSVGDVDPYSQSLPAGFTTWQPVYLTGSHPWGYIPGTNSWVNYSPDNTVGLNTRTPYRIRFVVPDDFSDPSMVFTLKADNRAVLWINDTYIDSIDGGGTSSPSDLTVSNALHTGVNEIRLDMVDWGGIVGFNYKIDVTMTSCEDIADAVLTPGEAAALNNAPLADAGVDQTSVTAAVSLDGSGSSDPDGNLLIYTWSENGIVIATGENPTITLVDGSHTIILTVSDGELSATDQVIVNVDTNDAPVANAGADQTIDCVPGSSNVALDGSASSDPDGDNLTYSWNLSGSTVSTDVSFTSTLSAGTHVFTLTVSDGQETHSDEISVTVIADTEAPVLTLLGDAVITQNIGDSFSDPGYTVADACDNDASVVVTGSVDVNLVGSYTLTYTATDVAGNVSVLTRTVEVLNTPPVADAGLDQTAECSSIFNLDGSGSTDDGTLSYSWTRSDVLVNGSFEDGMTGWTHSGYTGDGYGGNSFDLGNWAGAASHGDWLIDLVGTGNPVGGYVEQSIDTQVGGQYALSFDYYTSGSASLEVTIGGVPGSQILPSVGVFTSYTINFIATSSSTTIRLAADGSYNYLVNGVFLDNVSVDGLVSTSASFTTTTLPSGSYTYTLTVTDAFGETDSDDVSVTVEADTEAPALTLLGDNPASIAREEAYVEAGYDALDACDPDVTVSVSGSVDSNTSGLYTLTYTATDDAGNSTTVQRVVEVLNSAPVAMAGADQSIDCVVNETSITLDGSASIDIDGDVLTYSWTLGGSEVSTSASFAPTLPAGTYTYTLTVSDGELTATDDVSVTVVADTEPPVLSLLGTGPFSQNLHQAYTEAGWDASDACGLEVLVEVTGSIDVDTPGVYTLTYTATDAAGNQSTLDRIVTVINATPVALAGADQTIDCVIENTTVSFDGSSSSDADGDALSYSWSLDGVVLSTSATFSTDLEPGEMPYTITLTVSDGFNSSSDDLFVFVEADREPASITLLGDNPMDLNIHIPYAEAGYVTEDACGSAVTVDITGTVDIETPGEYTLTYLATDAGGNISVAQRVITVINAAPVAIAGADQSFECLISDASVTLDGSASSDSDGDALTYSWSLGGSVVATTASFSSDLGVGNYTFTLTVNDGFDSSSDDVLVSVVADTEPPVITLLGDNPAPLGLYLDYIEAGYETVDACGSFVTVDVTGTININVPGVYTLTYTATDEGGNASSVERDVEVFNTAPEVVNAVSVVVLSFGDDLLTTTIDLSTVFADIDVNDVLTYSYNNGNDAAAIASLTGSILTLDAVDLGESVVGITATDPWAATGTQNFTVFVNVTDDLAGALLFANSEIKIKKDAMVNSGNILVNEASHHGNDDDDDDGGHDDDDDSGHHDDDDDDGHHGHGHANLKIEKDGYVAPGYVLMADHIEIQRNTLIESDVYANTLDDDGEITGSSFGDVATPLFTNLPLFKSAPAGNQNINVNKNQEVVLPPGDYEKIVVKDRGTLTLTGGIYNIKKLETKKYSHVRFEETSEVRIEEELKIGKSSYVGPAGGSYIDASDIIFYIADDHKAAKLEQKVAFYGTIYAPNGNAELKKDVSFTGAILADKITIDKDADLAVNSFFGGTGSGLAKRDKVAWIEPEMPAELPEFYDLSANYPNPFNPSTTIDFALMEAGDVSLKIYDIRGAEVETLISGYQEAGHYSLHFTPEIMASGTYLYVLTAGDFREVRRMLYLK